MTIPYHGPERRRFVRIPFWYIVRYRIYSPNKKLQPELLTSRSKNLSLGGILLETNHFYPVSTMLELEFDVPIDTQHHVYAKVIGNVVRCNVIEQDKAFDTAVEFVSIPSEYRSSILRLINAFA